MTSHRSPASQPAQHDARCNPSDDPGKKGKSRSVVRPLCVLTSVRECVILNASRQFARLAKTECTIQKPPLLSSLSPAGRLSLASIANHPPNLRALSRLVGRHGKEERSETPQNHDSPPPGSEISLTQNYCRVVLGDNVTEPCPALLGNRGPFHPPLG